MKTIGLAVCFVLQAIGVILVTPVVLAMFIGWQVGEGAEKLCVMIERWTE